MPSGRPRITHGLSCSSSRSPRPSSSPSTPRPTGSAATPASSPRSAPCSSAAASCTTAGSRWSAPTCRCGAGIQRFTGITQAMVDGAPAPEAVLPTARARLAGRVMVAHNAPFDRRVLRQAFERCGLEWPDPAGDLHRRAGADAAAAAARAQARRRSPTRSGSRSTVAHRALADAETCARVLCALFPRLCANAATVADALALLGRRRRGARRPPPRAARRPPSAAPTCPQLDFGELPRDPGVYLFRDAAGATLVRRQVGLDPQPRARALRARRRRAPAGRTHAAVVDYRADRAPSSARWCSRTA